MQGSLTKRGISLVAIMAVLAQGPAVASHAVSTGQTGSQGLCRHPAALPQLGSEAQGRHRRNAHAGTPGDDAEGDVTAARSDEPMLGPPPPPPSEALPPPVTAIPTPAMRSIAPDAPRDSASEPTTSSGRSRGQPWPQAGILTAGEHDDLLNPELYALYQRRSNLGQALPDLPRLDTTRVLTVAVKDREGRPVPFAPVELACSDGGSLHLATTADGTVSFFPDLDRLGRAVKVRAGGSDWRDVAIAHDAGGQRVDFTLAGAARAVSKLDLILVIDTTGSMGDEIRYLQAELGAILETVRQRHPGVDIRVGFVFYRDLGDDYVTDTVPLTHDFASAERELARRGADGGGDYPEAMEQALIRAAGQDWRGDAVKSMLLVADAPPHDENVGLAWRASEVLRAQRVQIVPVAASGVADKAEYVMRAMAALTQSRYTFLTDDSGVGNPHAAPAIDCYLVTRLNALLLRVIDGQLTGRRIEPADQEVIREVGNYDHGKCVIPPGGLPNG